MFLIWSAPVAGPGRPGGHHEAIELKFSAGQRQVQQWPVVADVDIDDPLQQSAALYAGVADFAVVKCIGQPWLTAVWRRTRLEDWLGGGVCASWLE